MANREDIAAKILNSLMNPDDLAPTRWSLISRLKNWDDQASWREFFDTYWKLIYSVATKAGLSDAEAQDVVQETILTVAKKINDFKTDAARGSFKGWLLNTTRWRIADQFGKRLPPGEPHGQRSDETDRTATAERVSDPAGLVLESVWNDEWEENLRAAALEKVKGKVAPEEFQIFDLCVLRSCPVKQVAVKLGLKVWKVYFAQKKVSGLLQREVKKLIAAAK